MQNTETQPFTEHRNAAVGRTIVGISEQWLGVSIEKIGVQSRL